MKTCTKCGEEKPLDEYHKQSSGALGRRADCKACANKRTSEYYAANRGKVLSIKAKYDAGEKAERYRAGYRIRPEVKQKKADYIAEWRKDNIHAYWEGGYRRRSRSYGFEPIVESFTKAELIARHGDECVDCGGEWSELEHVIPVRFGGIHSLDNCEPICHPCNLRRWHRHQREAYDLIANVYGRAA